MKIFFEKSLAEMQKEREQQDYQAKIQQLQKENEELRLEIALTQQAVNELLFSDMEVE